MSDDSEKNVQQQHATCEQWKTNALKTNNVVKFMMSTMKKLGCPLKGCFVCKQCDQNVGGHFSLDEGIVLCENRLVNEDQAAETMVHESIHAFDYCRAKVNWDDCRHHACSEIRAANLSGDCRIMNEFARGNLFSKFSKQHQECVRRRALLSIRINPACSDRAEEVIDEVFDACFKDTEPFDEIY